MKKTINSGLKIQPFSNDCLVFYFLIICLALNIFLAFSVPAFSNPQTQSRKKNQPDLNQPRPGKISKIGFFMFESPLMPRTAAALKAKLLSPDSPASLKAFFIGPLESDRPESISAELQFNFTLTLVRLMRQGTFLLTWEETKGALKGEERQEGSRKPESKIREGSSGTGVDQLSQQGQGQNLSAAPAGIPPIVSYFYEADEAHVGAQTGFYTADGKRHLVSLILPDPASPPGYQVKLTVYESPYPPGQEPYFDEKKPENYEFDQVVQLPATGVLVVGFLDSRDTAYFLCFKVLNLAKDCDLRSLSARLINKVEPIYPEEARRQKLSGTVKLLVKLGTDGHVSQIKVIEADHPVLARASLEAVRQWVYKLPEFDGRTFPLVLLVTVTFKTDSRRPPIFIY